MKKNLLFTIPLLILFAGCVSQSTDTKENESELIESDSLKVQDLEHLLPSPAEFLTIVKDVGLSYNPDFISPLVNPSEFLLYRNQALNFGVYLTDFSYLLLFEKNTEAIQYLYHIQELSSLLGVETYFDDEFFNKIISNLTDYDTLRSLSIEQSTLFFNKMEALGNNDLTLLITSGAVVEAMYLTSGVINEKNISEETINTVIDLAYLFDSFYLHYSLNKAKEPTIAKLTDDLEELRDIFTSMSINHTSKAIRKDGKLMISSDVSHEVDEYNINKMKVIVKTIRDSIVNQGY